MYLLENTVSFKFGIVVTYESETVAFVLIIFFIILLILSLYYLGFASFGSTTLPSELTYEIQQFIVLLKV